VIFFNLIMGIIGTFQIFAQPYIVTNGAMFDTAEGLQKRAQRIYERAVATQAMPQGNETGMTDDERAILGGWIRDGAKTE